MKGKKAIIVISLVKEGQKTQRRNGTRDIRTLVEGLPTIPWLESVEKITVLEE